MSLPNIPNITPLISLNRCDTINLLLSSIALEEIGLSHILNAEGEKLQLFLKSSPKCLNDFLDINESVNKTLRTVVKSQILLELKLEDVVELDRKSHCKDVCCHDCRKDRCKHHSKDECCDECRKDRCKHHSKDECCNECCSNRCKHQHHSKIPCKHCQDKRLG